MPESAPHAAPAPAPARRRWLQRWFEARLARQDRLTLTQRNVYIVPSGAGWMLGLTLLALLLASINFQLNLGYALTFMLAGCALVGMALSHATLRGLQLQLLAPAPVFLGARATLQLALHNPGRQIRYGIGLAWAGQAMEVWADVPAQGSCPLSLGFSPARRGRLWLPTLSAETRFPLGIFRVWTLWRPATPLWVYPQPESPCPPLPGWQGRPDDTAVPRSGAADPLEWAGVRSYRRGDRLRQIVWKKSTLPRSDGQTGWLSRESAPAAGALWLDAHATGLPAGEAQLSRLCAWVLQAELGGLAYGLRVPGHEIAPGHGPAQRQRCLEVLALC